MRPRFSVAILVLQLLKSAAANDQPCNFSLDGLEFDLCPLFSGTSNTSVSLEEDTPPTHTTHRYALGLGAPLKRDVTLPSELQVSEVFVWSKYILHRRNSALKGPGYASQL